MFETIPPFEVKSVIPEGIFGEPAGTMHWRVVRKMLNVPSFILSLQFKGDEIVQTFFIGDLRDAVSLLARDDIESHELFVLLPDYLTDDREPALYRLAQAYEGEYDGYGVRGYVCANGRSFAEFDGGDLPQDAVIGDKTILYIKNHG